MTAQTNLSLLDGFALHEATVVLAVPVTVQRLLALLALRRSYHRNAIAGTLWPDVPEPQALGNLRTVLWRLNKVHPRLLVSDFSDIAIHPDLAVDCHAQEAAVSLVLGDGARPPVHIFEVPQALWSGQLLPGWYDDWVIFERERLSQLRMHALELAATEMIRSDRLEVALRLALESVRVDPLRETANRVLISVYLAEGNVCDALRQYRAFCRLLASELGLTPSPRLDALIAPLLAHH